MKKLTALIVISLISLTLFAEEFSLFPWFCNQKEIYTQCINKGWSYTDKSDKKMTVFYFEPTDDVTYKGIKVDSFYFYFDKNGNFVSQTITYAKKFDVLSGVCTLLDLATLDQTRLLNNKIKKEKIKFITYSGEINANTDVEYSIYGENDNLMVSIAYLNHNYFYEQ